MVRKPAFPVSGQELWRPSPEFTGPMMPPMLLWNARGRPKSAWEIAADERAERERQEARRDERQMSLLLDLED